MDKQLAQFILIYEQHSISKASRASGTSQPTLSENLKRLEEKYQTVLFYREPRGVSPTRAGTLLYAEAKKIEARYISVQKLLGIERSKATKSVRIGSGEAWWPKLVRPFLYNIDSISYYFVEGNNYSLLEKLNTGNLDILIGHEMRDIDLPSDIKFVPLFNDRPAFYVAKSHILTNISVISEEAISKFSRVSLIDSQGHDMANFSSMRVEHQLSSISSCIDLTLSSDGVFHFIESMSDYMAEKGLAKLNVTSEDTDTVGIYYFPERQNDSSKNFIKSIVESCG